MKYKLIKEYPGSPKLGSIAELYESSHYVAPHPTYKSAEIAIDKKHVEESTDYWEEVVDIWYVVLEEDFIYNDEFRERKHSSWKTQRVEAPSPESIKKQLYVSVKNKHIFKTKEEAEYFILRNKPCLSYNDIAGYLGSGQRDVILNLIEKL